MAKPDLNVAAHLEWIGFVRPTGLVVSAPALTKAGVILNRRDTEGQRRLAEWEKAPDRDFRSFAESVLGWRFSPAGYAGTEDEPIPPELQASATDTGEVLCPDFAVRAEAKQAKTQEHLLQVKDQSPDYNQSLENGTPWQLLVASEPDSDFDRVTRTPGGGLDASPHSRMERLLRQTGAPAGLLFNGEALRLVSAPRGESSGWLDFRVGDMLLPAGRPICTAMRELLKEQRLLAVPANQRLAALLASSRKFQNDVSERLAEQVLHALYELLRGFQASHEASKDELLSTALASDPNEVYRGLLTVVLRLVFLLYAEERDMLPQDETYLRGYAIASLYERLREDAAMHPDTMDQRYGAWAQLLALSRMVHDGAKSGAMQLPPRHGELFDPDRYRFLEARGHQQAGARQAQERIEPPLVSDGTLYRVLEKLIILDGERISYRALDVEHVGAVYETMMGFRLETAQGKTAAIKASKKYGAPAALDLDALLAEPPAKRPKWFQDRTDRKLTDKTRKTVQAAADMEALHAALDAVIDKNATPDLVAPGAMILQPSEERRRSGSHYTPRELTEPIVRDTLAPVLSRLNANVDDPPRAEQVLDLKVCDPAMGSGAFLVEACRQLGDAVIEAWHAHEEVPDIPEDEDEIIYARRLVAQRCLYGVDRNPPAVDLAKLSLWLATLAKDHPLTFLNHALRHGDSLVGLTREQIEAFHWKTGAKFQQGIEAELVREQITKVRELREQIRNANEDTSDMELRDIWDKAHFEAGKVCRLGDLTLAAFFEGKTARQREQHRKEFSGAVLQGRADSYRGWLEELRQADPPLAPFHWQIEFPEVFDRDSPGFDSIVGNPPFLGGKRVSTTLGKPYRDWLASLHVESNSNADLVAHFFRRAFDILQIDGALGFIATNTIAQGETRASGLRWICENGGEIYCAKRRYQWPGQAAVVVSVIHVAKGHFHGVKRLDNDAVDRITAFLSHRGSHDDPARLAANADKSFIGFFLRGMGFTFDDTNNRGIATPLTEMRRLIEENPRNRDVILPYIGGQEVNTSPAYAHHRYAINFRDWPLRRDDIGESWEDAEPKQREKLRRKAVVPLDYPGPVASDWPEVLAIVKDKVKPFRDQLGNSPINKAHKITWWRFANDRPQLQAAIAGLHRVLVISRIGNAFAFTFLPTNTVYSDKVVVFPFPEAASLGTLQSRVHEIWARFFSTTLKDDLQYTPTKCFTTFPLPNSWRTNAKLEATGKDYYDFRAALMVKNNQGLTKTYNRFHNPYENDPEIDQLRDLHAAIDRAVLDAYGWQDIPTDCEFLLEYPIDEAEWGRKKKPYRYRWPDEIRDEVLARLLQLNAQRAAEEARNAASDALQ